MSILTYWNWKEEFVPHPEALEYETTIRNRLPRLLYNLMGFYQKQGLTPEHVFLQNGIMNNDLAAALIASCSINRFAQYEEVEEAIFLDCGDRIGLTVPDPLVPLWNKPQPAIIANIDPQSGSIKVIPESVSVDVTNPLVPWKNEIRTASPLAETLLPTLSGMLDGKHLHSSIRAVNVPPSTPGTTEFQINTKTVIPGQDTPHQTTNSIILLPRIQRIS